VNDKDYFLGDKTDLMELLGNLIDNACKACRSQVSINVSQARTLSISICDDGPGISLINVNHCYNEVRALIPTKADTVLEWLLYLT
jgi:signal transduction histidine kinase